MLDVLIRGGRIADGRGGPMAAGDVAIEAGRLVEIGGRISQAARHVIDADGALVTPGFVDVHTHYDAQLHWDPQATPTNRHGVTTLVIGNCGLGLAPVRPADRPALQGLMGGVEDIPLDALDEGLDFAWEDLADYCAALEALPLAVDVGVLVAHAALRVFAMGAERAYHETANAREIEQMAELLRQAIAAGALGVSTSRSRLDRDTTGRVTPCVQADDHEVDRLADTLAVSGRGLFQLAYRGSAGDEIEGFESELAWLRRLAERASRPISFGIAQLDAAPDLWRRAFSLAREAKAIGLTIRPQVLGRMQSVLIGLETVHPFRYRPSYRAIEGLPVAERAARMRAPELRARILAEEAGTIPDDDPFASLFAFDPERIYVWDDRPDYEPGPEWSLERLAARVDITPTALLYDRITANDGDEMLLYAVANYAGGDDATNREMIASPHSLLGLGDGGAHSGLLCDASVPTGLLSHWCRDRRRGPRLPLEFVVRQLTRESADLFGLHDRGRLEVGLRADLNVIDFDALSLERPCVRYDLPAGARRIVQEARGYLATIVGGEITRLHDEDTGARPGRIARTSQRRGRAH